MHRSNKKLRVDILYPGNFLDNDVISHTHILGRNSVTERKCYQYLHLDSDLITTEMVYIANFDDTDVFYVQLNSICVK